jgi:hypothetical protein
MFRRLEAIEQARLARIGPLEPRSFGPVQKVLRRLALRFIRPYVTESEWRSRTRWGRSKAPDARPRRLSSLLGRSTRGMVAALEDQGRVISKLRSEAALSQAAARREMEKMHRLIEDLRADTDQLARRLAPLHDWDAELLSSVVERTSELATRADALGMLVPSQEDSPKNE